MEGSTEGEDELGNCTQDIAQYLTTEGAQQTLYLEARIALMLKNYPHLVYVLGQGLHMVSNSNVSVYVLYTF